MNRFFTSDTRTPGWCGCVGARMARGEGQRVIFTCNIGRRKHWRLPDQVCSVPAAATPPGPPAAGNIAAARNFAATLEEMAAEAEKAAETATRKTADKAAGKAKAAQTRQRWHQTRR